MSFLILAINLPVAHNNKGYFCKIVSDELFNISNNKSSKNFKKHAESFLNLDDCINENYNYESSRSRLVSKSNSDKIYNNLISCTQDNLVPITFGELITKD